MKNAAIFLIFFAFIPRSHAGALPKEAPERTPDAFLAAEDNCKTGQPDLVGLLSKPNAETAPGWNLLTPEVRTQMAFYQGCLAAVSDQRTGATCDTVKPVDGVYAQCQEIAGFASLVWAVLNKGDVRTACSRYTLRSQSDRRRGGHATPEQRTRRCEVLVSSLRANRGDSVCADLLAARLIPSEQASRCRELMAYWSGKPDSCKAVPQDDREGCRMKAGFLAAARAGTPAECMPSPLCGAMMARAPRACEPYLNAAQKSYCDAARHAGDGIRKGRKVQEEKKASDKMQYKKGQPMGTLNPELQKTLKKMRDKSAPEPTENKDKEPENPQGQSQEQE